MRVISMCSASTADTYHFHKFSLCSVLYVVQNSFCHTVGSSEGFRNDSTICTICKKSLRITCQLGAHNITGPEST